MLKVSRSQTEEKMGIYEDKCNRAADSSTSPDTLRELSNSYNITIVSLVAANPSTPPETLRKLAEHVGWEVTSAVAANPSTPADIISQFAKNEDWIHRSGAASNPNIPQDALDKLLLDSDKDVRYRAEQTDKKRLNNQTNNER